jgi:hypothetical protein
MHPVVLFHSESFRTQAFLVRLDKLRAGILAIHDDALISELLCIRAAAANLLSGLSHHRGSCRGLRELIVSKAC